MTRNQRRAQARQRYRPIPHLGFHSLAHARAHAHRLHDLQRSRCYLCGEPFGAGQRYTFDHVRPKSRVWLRGRAARANLLLAHGPCNHAKADRDPTACELLFLAFITDRLADPCGPSTLVAAA